MVQDAQLWASRRRLLEPAPADEGAGGGPGDPAGPRDRELVARAVTDPEAFAELYRRHVDPIYRFAYRRSGSREVAEDVTSATFEKALRGLDRFEWRDGGVRAWLYRIASHELIDHHRRAGRDAGSRPSAPCGCSAPTSPPRATPLRPGFPSSRSAPPSRPSTAGARKRSPPVPGRPVDRGDRGRPGLQPCHPGRGPPPGRPGPPTPARPGRGCGPMTRRLAETAAALARLASHPGAVLVSGGPAPRAPPVRPSRWSTPSTPSR